MSELRKIPAWLQERAPFETDRDILAVSRARAVDAANAVVRAGQAKKAAGGNTRSGSVLPSVWAQVEEDYTAARKAAATADLAVRRAESALASKIATLTQDDVAALREEAVSAYRGRALAALQTLAEAADAYVSVRANASVTTRTGSGGVIELGTPDVRRFLTDLADYFKN